MAADRVERTLTTVLATAAVVLTTIAVRREFFPPAEARSVGDRPPTIEVAWKAALPLGIRVGDSTARVTLVVFSDLECPACAAFHETVRRVLSEREKELYRELSQASSFNPRAHFG